MELCAVEKPWQLVKKLESNFCNCNTLSRQWNYGDITWQRCVLHISFKNITAVNRTGTTQYPCTVTSLRFFLVNMISVTCLHSLKIAYLRTIHIIRIQEKSYCHSPNNNNTPIGLHQELRYCHSKPECYVICELFGADLQFQGNRYFLGEKKCPYVYKKAWCFKELEMGWKIMEKTIPC